MLTVFSFVHLTKPLLAWSGKVNRLSLLLMLPLMAAAGTGVTTQTLTATVNPAWRLSAPASVAMAGGPNPFQPFRATFPVSYQVRTTPSGSGSITLRVTSDFSPSGGPTSVAGGLTYTCGAAGLGAACSGTQTASTSSQTPVVTLPASACTGGGGVCSNQDPNSLNLTFVLTDDPQYKTGSYSATITFTISAM
jgi:hypothetical protein